VEIFSEEHTLVLLYLAGSSQLSVVGLLCCVGFFFVLCCCFFFWCHSQTSVSLHDTPLDSGVSEGGGVCETDRKDGQLI